MNSGQNDDHASVSRTGLSDLISMFRREGDLTRSEVMSMTGLSRTTVNQRMDALIAENLLTPIGAARSTGGRRPSRFAFHAGGRHVLVAEIGASGLRATLNDLAGAILAERYAAINVSAGPAVVLGQVDAFFDELLEGRSYPAPPLGGIGIGVPGPVDYDTGRIVSPPIMPGWDGYDVRSHFARFDVPVVVDNDANAMALGEQRTIYPQARSLLMIKASTGVGAGIVFRGQVNHGADGGAGDIGHITISSSIATDHPKCVCGGIGCAEAIAGGWALLRDMKAHGRDVERLTDFIDLVRARDPLAVNLAVRASNVLGDLIAGAVTLLNPSHVVIGGTMLQAEEIMLAGIRQAVYNRCRPLATRSIQIQPSKLDPYAGNVGLALMCANDALIAEGILAKPMAAVEMAL